MGELGFKGVLSRLESLALLGKVSVFLGKVLIMEEVEGGLLSILEANDCNL